MFPSTLFLPARKKRLLFAGSSTCGFELYTQNILQLQFLPEQFHICWLPNKVTQKSTNKIPNQAKIETLAGIYPYFSDFESSKGLPKIIRFLSSKHPKKKNFATSPKTPSLGGVPPAEGALVQEQRAATVLHHGVGRGHAREAAAHHDDLQGMTEDDRMTMG